MEYPQTRDAVVKPRMAHGDACGDQKAMPDMAMGPYLSRVLDAVVRKRLENRDIDVSGPHGDRKLAWAHKSAMSNVTYFARSGTLRQELRQEARQRWDQPLGDCGHGVYIRMPYAAILASCTDINDHEKSLLATIANRDDAPPDLRLRSVCSLLNNAYAVRNPVRLGQIIGTSMYGFDMRKDCAQCWDTMRVCDDDLRAWNAAGGPPHMPQDQWHTVVATACMTGRTSPHIIALGNAIQPKDITPDIAQRFRTMSAQYAQVRAAKKRISQAKDTQEPSPLDVTVALRWPAEQVETVETMFRVSGTLVNQLHVRAIASGHGSSTYDAAAVHRMLRSFGMGNTERSEPSSTLTWRDVTACIEACGVLSTRGQSDMQGLASTAVGLALMGPLLGGHADQSVSSRFTVGMEAIGEAFTRAFPS